MSSSQIIKVNELQTIDIVRSIVFTFLTFGIYYLVWQYKQFKQVNVLLGEKENDFVKWIILGILTLGIYHLYHEYKMSKAIQQVQRKYGMKESHELFPLICLVISIFGLFLVIDFVHQEELNQIILHIKKSSSSDLQYAV